MDMDRRTRENFQQSRVTISQLPCLAYYNSKSENILTTDASTKGLELQYDKDRRMAT